MVTIKVKTQHTIYMHAMHNYRQNVPGRQGAASRAHFSFKHDSSLQVISLSQMRKAFQKLNGTRKEHNHVCTDKRVYCLYKFQHIQSDCGF